MEFVSEKHKERFAELRSGLYESQRHDKEYLSVVYVMAADEELKQKILPYFDKDEGFRSSDMLSKEDFSSGMVIMAKLAVHLFNNNETINPLEMIGSLDDSMFQVALNAMKLRRYGLNKKYTVPEEKFYM